MNTRREISTNAPPGKRLAIQDVPASHEVKCGRGRYAITPLKVRNPAPSILAPWIILPLAIAAWGAVGVLAAAALHIAGGLNG